MKPTDLSAIEAACNQLRVKVGLDSTEISILQQIATAFNEGLEVPQGLLDCLDAMMERHCQPVSYALSTQAKANGQARTRRWERGKGKGKNRSAK